MKPIVIIPCRLNSSRLPEKMLHNISGRPLIVHVVQQALKLEVPIIVAVCHEKTAHLLHQYFDNKIQTILTDPDLPSGTDRVWSAFSQIDNNQDYDLIINLQGDNLNINQEVLKAVQRPFINHQQTKISTLVTAIFNKDDIENPSIVKVAVENMPNGQKKAQYFSRSPIPYGAKSYFKHIGIYAYRPEVLKNIIEASVSDLERIEKLEQLRFLQLGYNINVEDVDFDAISVDTLDDIAKAESFLKNIEIT